MKIEAYDLLKSRITTLIIAVMVIFSSCTNPLSEKQVGSDAKKVLVSITPYKYFVDRISGGLVEVMVLIPPGTSPHAYDPTPRQLVEIGKTDIYFTNGLLTFEQAWLERMKNTHASIKIINLSAGLQLIEGEDVHNCDHDHDHEHHHHDHYGVDPHTWVSVVNAKTFARLIHSALSDKYPVHAEVFQQNFSELENELDEVHQQITKMLSDVPGRSFMIFHPALGYFARDYGLNQISIEFEGKEPSPQQLKNSISQARNENIKAILIQKEFDKENAKIIAKEIGGKVVQIDPLDENWMAAMIQAAEAILNSWQ